MSIWLFIALAAHFLYALVYIFDKFILSKTIKSSLSYAFYTSFFGGFIFIIIPFVEFHVLDPAEIVIALSAGALSTLALILFYETLKISETSRAVPFIGALVPIATLGFSYLLGIEGLGANHFTAFIFLVAGGFLMVLGYQNNYFWSRRNLFFALCAALLFGLSFVLTKHVFNQTNFVSGLIWTRFGSGFFAVMLLLHPVWRASIRITTRSSTPESVVWFFSSKAIGAAAVILQNYAISLGSVILVNSLQSTQYLFILIAASLLSMKFPDLFQETLRRSTIAQKIAAIIVISIGLAVLIFPLRYLTGFLMGVY